MKKGNKLNELERGRKTDSKQCQNEKDLNQWKEEFYSLVWHEYSCSEFVRRRGLKAAMQKCDILKTRNEMRKRYWRTNVIK